MSTKSNDKTHYLNMGVELIENLLKKNKKDKWANSAFESINKLTCNDTGEFGEKFLANICNKLGVEQSIDGSKTKQKGGGTIGDGTIMKKTIEVKAAREGMSSDNFQHELGEEPWHAEYLCFIDVSPNHIYLTLFKNLTEEDYKRIGNSKEKTKIFPTKTITWRKKKGNFKLDTTVKINEENIKVGKCIKITDNKSDFKKYLYNIFKITSK